MKALLLIAATVGAGCAAQAEPIERQGAEPREDGTGPAGDECEPYDHFECQDRAIFHVDSCGQRGEIAFQCSASSVCEEDTCSLREPLTSGPTIDAMTGYPGNSWASEPDGLRQTRLGDDAADVILVDFAGATSFDVEVTAASTEVQLFDSSDLRHVMVFAEALGEDADTVGYGCGLEVEGTTPTTAIVRVGPGGEASPIARSDRASVVENQEFVIRAAYDGATLTCVSEIDGVQTAVEAQLDLPAGFALGFYTRESRALFRNLVARGPL